MIIWPAHLDSAKTRGQGRRLPVSRSVKQPSLKEVWQAAMTLGYSPEMTEKAAISHSPWDKTGYVTVKKTGQRAMMLKGIAGEIVKTRQKEAQASEQQQQKKKR